MSEQLELVVEWVAILCLLAGALLTFIAGVGLVRFPDLLSRMHTAAKPQVLGLLLVLVGLGLKLVPAETNVFNIGTLVLVGIFQIVTVPVAGHIAARVGYRTNLIKRDLMAIDELADQLDQQERAREEVQSRFR